jgi:hypothetical protein
MLISHKHKFLIIAIPKTASSSIRRTLVSLGVVDERVCPRPVHKNEFKQHGTISEAITEFNKRSWNYNDYFKYSIVRNPWDRYLSFLTYYKTRLDFYKNNKPLNNNQKIQKNQIIRRFNNKTDREILRDLIIQNPAQSFYLVDSNNNIIMDRIGQLENIQNDFNDFCRSVKITEQLLLHKNKSKFTLSKTDLYTQELVDMVMEKEKWVINEYGYDFI